MQKIISTLTVFFMITLPALANEEILPTALTNNLAQDTISTGGIIRTILSLVIVIGLIYMTAWGYKKLNIINENKLAIKSKDTDINKFNIINSLHLGPNKTLYVVEINNKYLVLGATQQNINLIKEFDKNLTQKFSHYAPTLNSSLVEDKQIRNILDKYNSL